jgi:hypothetical protein
MTVYPSAIYTARAIENRSGVVYEFSKKTVLFAEDVSKLNDEVNAIETELGTSPKGSYADVDARLSAIEKDVSNAGFFGGGGKIIWQNINILDIVANSSYLALGFVQISTTNVAGNESYCIGGLNDTFRLDFSNNFIWECKHYSASVGDADWFVGAGDYLNNDDGSLCGFFIDNGVGYAVLDDGVGSGRVLTALSSFAGKGSYTYRIEFEAGVEARFYVNGTLQATVSANLPSSLSYIFNFYGIENSGGAVCYTNFGPLTFVDNALF